MHGFIDLREELFVKYTYLSIAFSYLLYFILLKIKIKNLCLFSHLASGESTFGELFGEAAAKYEMLCIGLYRLVKILHKIIFSQGFLHAHKEACAKVPSAFLSHFCYKL